MYSSKAACTYGTDGKCQGMLAPKRIDILYNAFDRAKHSGTHDTIQTSPKALPLSLWASSHALS
eukprot:1154900-Pelagomonas_calceolata.AAC.2